MKTEVRKIPQQSLPKPARNYPYIAGHGDTECVILFIKPNVGIVLYSLFPDNWPVGKEGSITESNYYPLSPTEEFVMRND